MVIKDSHIAFLKNVVGQTVDLVLVDRRFKFELLRKPAQLTPTCASCCKDPGARMQLKLFNTELEAIVSVCPVSAEPLQFGLECLAANADYGNRSDAAASSAPPIKSFAPPRESTPCKWLVDGAAYFYDLAEALEQAKEEIFIADWFLSPEVLLRRPCAGYHELINILYRRAKVAFFGGLDLCWGRWDIPEHPILDNGVNITEFDVNIPTLNPSFELEHVRLSPRWSSASITSPWCQSGACPACSVSFADSLAATSATQRPPQRRRRMSSRTLRHRCRAGGRRCGKRAAQEGARLVQRRPGRLASAEKVFEFCRWAAEKLSSKWPCRGRYDEGVDSWSACAHVTDAATKQLTRLEDARLANCRAASARCHHGGVQGIA
uniref:Phospholipase D n=1 Tax=Macrostomum lignano TaxID=282301 RepID=A0A1I8FLD4_9PLAT